MLVRTLHALANLGNVGKDGLLVAFTETLWRGDLIALCAGASQVGMRRVEQGEEAVQEQVVRDGRRRVVLPDARALHHVTLLHFGFGSGLVLLGRVSSSGGELGLKVVLDLLLAGLLLLLECGKVALGRLVVVALLLLGRLLLLLRARQPMSASSKFARARGSLAPS